MYLVILGISEFVLVIILNNQRKLPILFWAILITVTFWFLLSILVVIGTNGKHQRLLLVSAVLGILGELGDLLGRLCSHLGPSWANISML